MQEEDELDDFFKYDVKKHARKEARSMRQEDVLQ